MELETTLVHSPQDKQLCATLSETASELHTFYTPISKSNKQGLCKVTEPAGVWRQYAQQCAKGKNTLSENIPFHLGV